MIDLAGAAPSASAGAADDAADSAADGDQANSGPMMFAGSSGAGDGASNDSADNDTADDAVSGEVSGLGLSAAGGGIGSADAADDIERVEGIGPKIGKALRDAGYGTYAKVASASEEELLEAIKAGGIKFAPSIGTWAEQAALLRDGDEAGFVALTDSLTAGREKA